VDSIEHVLSEVAYVFGHGQNGVRVGVGVTGASVKGGLHRLKHT